MARYYVRTVENDLLPAGTSWMFIDEPDGDASFIVGRNDAPVEIPACVLDALLEKVQAAYERPVAS